MSDAGEVNFADRGGGSYRELIRRSLDDVNAVQGSVQRGQVGDAPSLSGLIAKEIRIDGTKRSSDNSMRENSEYVSHGNVFSHREDELQFSREEMCLNRILWITTALLIASAVHTYIVIDQLTVSTFLSAPPPEETLVWSDPHLRRIYAEEHTSEGADRVNLFRLLDAISQREKENWGDNELLILLTSNPPHYSIEEVDKIRQTLAGRPKMRFRVATTKLLEWRQLLSEIGLDSSELVRSMSSDLDENKAMFIEDCRMDASTYMNEYSVPYTLDISKILSLSTSKRRMNVEIVTNPTSQPIRAIRQLVDSLDIVARTTEVDIEYSLVQRSDAKCSLLISQTDFDTFHSYLSSLKIPLLSEDETEKRGPGDLLRCLEDVYLEDDAFADEDEKAPTLRIIIDHDGPGNVTSDSQLQKLRNALKAPHVYTLLLQTPDSHSDISGASLMEESRRLLQLAPTQARLIPFQGKTLGAEVAAALDSIGDSDDKTPANDTIPMSATVAGAAASVALLGLGGSAVYVSHRKRAMLINSQPENSSPATSSSSRVQIVSSHIVGGTDDWSSI